MIYYTDPSYGNLNYVPEQEPSKLQEDVHLQELVADAAYLEDGMTGFRAPICVGGV